MSKQTVQLDVACAVGGLAVYLVLLSLSPLVVSSAGGINHLSVELLAVVAMGLACAGTFFLAQVREASLRANAELGARCRARGEPLAGRDLPGDGSVGAFNALAVFLGILVGIMIKDPGSVLPEQPFAAMVAMALIDGLVGLVLILEYGRLRATRDAIDGDSPREHTMLSIAE